MDNKILIEIEEKISQYGIMYILQTINLFINIYIYFAIVCNDKNVKIISVISLILLTLLQVVLSILNIESLYFIFNTVYLIIIPIIVKRKFFIKKQLIVSTITILYQIISIIIRGQNINSIYNSQLIDFLMNFDQTIMLIITYLVYFSEGGIKCLLEVFSSSLKKIHLRKLLNQLQRNLDNFKKKPKVEKLEISIYIILSLIWNVLSVVLILFVAKLNDTFIECLFILTSFWLSKGAFGKPFHFSSMAKCFVVSNLTYYALNRVTTPLGISIIVPIILGVGLSYVTSKFVKEPATKLYKGIPEEEFDNSILKVTDKDSLQYKICHMFYIDRKSELEIAHNVGYSIDNIKKIKAKINKKIKELN